MDMQAISNNWFTDKLSNYDSSWTFNTIKICISLFHIVTTLVGWGYTRVISYLFFIHFTLICYLKKKTGTGSVICKSDYDFLNRKMQEKDNGESYWCPRPKQYLFQDIVAETLPLGDSKFDKIYAGKTAVSECSLNFRWHSSIEGVSYGQ